LQLIYADWGRQQLADLNATPPRKTPEAASRYLLTYLAKHLEAVDTPTADFMPLVEDGWRRAKERLSGTGGFAADVRAAWDACRRGGPVAHIGEQWRCVLTLSSIQSLGQNIPGPLLVQLVRHGQLSASEARHFLELKGPDEKAVTALAEIAVVLAERDEAQQAQEFYGATLALAARDRDNKSHCELLGAALDTLGDHSLWAGIAERRRRALAEALAAARAIGDEGSRARALAAVAPQLTDPAQLAEALAAARAIGHEGSRAEALAAVAPQLTDLADADRAPLSAALLDEAAQIPRHRCLEVVESSAALTAAIGGEDAVAALARAIRDTAAWYP
jgi:hypothetical protein